MEKVVCNYDFTIGEDKINKDEVINILKEYCKKWTFQLERGETGYLHYQGRISLKLKARMGTVINNFDNKSFHFSVTSTENCRNDFYVSKEETRIDGPWKDSDTEVYIPRQFRNLVLKDWQLDIIERSKIFDSRTINVLYDPDGGIGKSTLSCLCELTMKGVTLPIVNEQEKMIQAMHGICSSRKLREPNPVFIDLPRAFDKSKLYGIYSAIEQIKNGKLVDMRYSYNEYWIDSPSIWVFSNREPDPALLSKDRWKIWQVIDDKLEEILFEEVEE